MVPDADEVDAGITEFWFPINLFFIEGTPKHVPKTTEQPTTPLANGIKIFFPKLYLFFWLKLAFEVLLQNCLNYYFLPYWRPPFLCTI